MGKGHGYFDYMENIMKYHCHWYDHPDTLRGKLMKVYNVFRIVLSLALLIGASSQMYYYGKSYLVHHSAVFVPIGVMGFVVNSSLAWNYRPIMKSAAQFDIFLNSFTVDWEKESIENRMKKTENLVTRIVDVIKLYIYLSAVIHGSGMLVHYFFGILSKPVVLPLIFEMFMEGNYELRPSLFFTVVFSVVFTHMHSGLVMDLGHTVHFLGSAAGALEVLITRLENISAKAGEGCEMLTEDADLRDTIQKHADLLNIINDMMDWNGFPIAFLVTACSILFCLNAITAKQSLQIQEYYIFFLWGTFLLVCLILAYATLLSGQEVEMKSEELLRAIYKLPWYRESSKSRKTVAMMLVQSNRLIILNYRGLMKLNLVTYSEMLQTSYTYFMLLRSIE